MLKKLPRLSGNAKKYGAVVLAILFALVCNPVTGYAMDNIETDSIPIFSKSFIADPLEPGGSVTLEFTITNSSMVSSATNITFTDDLDATLAGLSAVSLPISNICGPGSALNGISLISFTGGSLAPAASCTFSVTLQVPAGAAPGSYINTTNHIMADIDGMPVTGDPAVDTLEISPPIAIEDEVAAQLPKVYHLSEAYPNPFNPFTQFTLTVAQTQRVRIVIFDVSGASVGVLHEGLLSANEAHVLNFDAAGLQSGIFFIHVSGDAFSAVRKVILLK